MTPPPRAGNCGEQGNTAPGERSQRSDRAGTSTHKRPNTKPCDGHSTKGSWERQRAIVPGVRGEGKQDGWASRTDPCGRGAPAARVRRTARGVLTLDAITEVLKAIDEGAPHAPWLGRGTRDGRAKGGKTRGARPDVLPLL